MGEKSRRIEFVDLAKGVCILMVISVHCGVPLEVPGWEIVRMPLYFVLSGLFYKDYGGWRELLTRKTNKILVPFVFFYLLGNVFYYALRLGAGDAFVSSSRGIFDVFTNRTCFNGPVWFLLALFWCHVLFCGVTRVARSERVRLVLVMLLGAAGWYSGNVVHAFVPLFFDVACTSLPFFAFGYYLKRTPLLYPNGLDRYNVLFALVLWAAAYGLTRSTRFSLSLYENVLQGWSTYLIALLSVMSLLFLCKAVGRLPLVSYFGRYSIIPLCVHHIIYRASCLVSVKLALGTPWPAVVATFVLSWAAIPFCRRYLPRFTAQEDLIRTRSV